MLDDLISAYGNRFLVAALGVSLALLCLFIVLWILRNRAPSPFVRGGRNRQPRLQVLDAAAVDTRRRIVLIRRDNVEHLVMIGGPTDIVIESGIGDERAYLSARPVNPLPLEDQPELPKPATTPSLAAAEPPAPQIAAPPAAASTPVEPPVRRPATPQPSMPEPSARARMQPVPASVADQRRPQPAPPRPVDATAEEPAAPAVAPVAAAPIAAAAVAAAPAVIGSSHVDAEAMRPATADAPKVETTTRAMHQVEARPTPDAPAPQPTASLEPVIAVEATASPATVDPERAWPGTEMSRVAPAIEPDVTAGTPPIEAFRVEPVEPVMTEEKIEPAPEQEAQRAAPEPAPAPVTPPVIDPPAAADLLEAARQRVLAPAPPPAPLPAAPGPVEPQRFEPVAENRPVAAAPEPPARDMSDFERVLEEEMALHLAADPAPMQKPAPAYPQILPETRADRPRPPVSAILPDNGPTAGAPSSSAQQAQEPNLQTEIARIFGEMSASRNP